jgi:hypothetical protein
VEYVWTLQLLALNHSKDGFNKIIKIIRRIIVLALGNISTGGKTEYCIQVHNSDFILSYKAKKKQCTKKNGGLHTAPPALFIRDYCKAWA